MCMVTCKAPVNIAVIKYWGKRDEDLLLPLNDSVSVTLDMNEMFAQTTVATSKTFTKNRMWLNGREESVDNPRIQNCLREIRRRARKRKADSNGGDISVQEEMLNWNIHICSVNNFPTAAGLASSAAGYACLVFALAKLYNLEMDVSEIARQGSGSACRSIHGGFVQWGRGVENDGSDSVARQLAPSSHWPELHILILVVSDKRKHVGSTTGMETTVKTSELLQHRVDVTLPKRIPALLDAIQSKDFRQFAKITMQESNQLHAVCLDTMPPIVYLNDVSHSIMRLVHKFNDFFGEPKVAYTFDAGPNAFLFMLESTVPMARAVIEHYFPNDSNDYFRGMTTTNGVTITKELEEAITVDVQPCAIKNIIHTKVGQGPQLMSGKAVHLLKEDGLPQKTEI